MNAEAGQNDALPCDKDRDEFSRRDIRIELEIDARPAVKVAGISDHSLIERKRLHM